MKIARVIVGSALAGLGLLGLNAGTNGFYVPTFRGETGAKAGYWESFTVPVGAPGNTANFGNDTTSVLTQSVPGAFITGTGNLYNMAVASAFTLSYAGAGPAGLVVLQTRTFGTELDYAAVRLNYNGGSLAAPRTELNRLAVGEPGQPGSGSFVSSAWQWDLTGLGVSHYTLSFNAVEHSLSLDSITLDTQAVPEPSTLALAGLGIAVAAWAVRRRA